MTRRSTALLFCFQVFLLCSGCARPSPDSSVRETPPECALLADEVIRYLLANGASIADDTPSQSKWLTASLRTELTDAVRRCREEATRRPDERIHFPSNSTFLLAWDPPSAFRVLGSRRYCDLAIVDFEFSWGQGTQYEGNRRIMSYVFRLDDGSWRLDDVYSFREEYAQPACLSQELRSAP